jgi:hypothetical protein
MELEEFLSQHPISRSAAFTSHQCQHHSDLHDVVRQAACLGLKVFPVSPLAKLTGNPNLLIGEASFEISCLDELVAAHGPCCEWRVAVDPSLCILRIDGEVGRDSVAALSQYDQEECLTLRACRGNTMWVFFRRPKGFALRASAKSLAPGVSVLIDGDSCPLPASSESASDISAVPYWLRELAFEAPDNPPGKAALAPVSTPCPASCRPTTHFLKPHRGVQKGYPTCGQAGWRGGYRIARRR